MKINLGSGLNPLTGFENLDQRNGWWIEGGLDYGDETIEGATVSHLLMYVEAEDWPFGLSEIHRVLKPGGVLRVTEDNTEDPESERAGGYHEAVTLTGPAMMREQLEAAGFQVVDQRFDTSAFTDLSLCQVHHGGEPKVFFIEGIKP